MRYAVEKIWIKCNNCGETFFLSKMTALSKLEVMLSSTDKWYRCKTCGMRMDSITMTICLKDEEGDYCNGCEQLFRCYFEKATKKA